jgi:hypothetical protein
LSKTDTLLHHPSFLFADFRLNKEKFVWAKIYVKILSFQPLFADHFFWWNVLLEGNRKKKFRRKGEAKYE